MAAAQSKFLWLVRDGDELVNHCRCEVGRVGMLPQQDCPWCGCGWLFSCVTCRKAFAFARAEMLDGSLEDLAREDFPRKCGRVPSAADLTEYVEFLAGMVEGLEAGDRVVVLDGVVIRADHEGPVEFDGIYARHELEWLPHPRAPIDPEVETEILGNVEYWTSRRIEDEE